MALTCCARRHTVLFMKSFTAAVERCPDTGLYVGYVPGFVGAHSQGGSLDELKRNLEEVVPMLLEDGEPSLEAQFLGTQTIQVGQAMAKLEPEQQALRGRQNEAQAELKRKVRV